MRPSSLFILPASIGLAAGLLKGEVVARGEVQRYDGQRGQVCSSSPKQGLGMTFWNDFSQPINDDVACVAFRGLEWLAYNLIKPTQEITSEAGTRVFVSKYQQSGPLVLNLRAMMIWTRVLNELRVQLEATDVWSLEAQLHVAQCYLDYAFQTGAWLSSLQRQSCDFNPSDPATCLMYDKIEALYVAYTGVANQVYGKNTGVPKRIEELITDNFPDPIPSWFKTRFSEPQPGRSIAEYIAANDWALPQAGQLFAKNQEAWACTDYRGGVRPWCTTEQQPQQ